MLAISGWHGSPSRVRWVARLSEPCSGRRGPNALVCSNRSMARASRPCFHLPSSIHVWTSPNPLRFTDNSPQTPEHLSPPARSGTAKLPRTSGTAPHTPSHPPPCWPGHTAPNSETTDGETSPAPPQWRPLPLLAASHPHRPVPHCPEYSAFCLYRPPESEFRNPAPKQLFAIPPPTPIPCFCSGRSRSYEKPPSPRFFPRSRPVSLIATHCHSMTCNQLHGRHSDYSS